MATTLSTICTSWRRVNGNNSPVGGTGMIGWEPGPSRPSGARYQFTSPSNGATTLNWRSETFALTSYHAQDDSTGHYKTYARLGPHYNFAITTDPDGYKYYSGDAGWDCSYDKDDRYLSGAVNVNLLPNTTYYLFVFPDTYHQDYYAIFSMGTITLVVDGAYGTSSITATSANIGSTSTLTISRYSSSFTHTLQYKIAGQSSFTTIVNKTSATSYSWTVPTSTYDYMSATGTSVSITINCITYNGSTNIGSKTTTLTAYAVESACKPTISASYELLNDASPYTGNSTTAILNWSNVKITISASAKNGASISSYAIVHNGGTTNSNTGTYNKIQVGTFTCRTQDSRGYTNEQTIIITTIPYFVPSITLTVVPPDAQTGETDITTKGNVYTGSFGAVNNALTVQYRYKLQGGSYTDWANLPSTGNNNSYTTSKTTIILDYRQKYVFQARVIDTLNTTNSEEMVVVKLPLFDWAESNFNFNVPITLAANSYGSTLPSTGIEGQVFIKI